MPRNPKTNSNDFLSKINASVESQITSKNFDNLEISLIQDLRNSGDKDIKGKKFFNFYSTSKA